MNQEDRNAIVQETYNSTAPNLTTKQLKRLVKAREAQEAEQKKAAKKHAKRLAKQKARWATGLKTVEDLAENAKDEDVRLKAALELRNS